MPRLRRDVPRLARFARDCTRLHATARRNLVAPPKAMVTVDLAEEELSFLLACLGEAEGSSPIRFQLLQKLSVLQSQEYNRFPTENEVRYRFLY